MISVSVRNCFISQWMKWSKHGLFVSPPKENPNMEKALFDWPVVLQYDVKANYRLISRQFSGMTFFHPSVHLTNQKPRTFVSGRQTNQIALYPFVCCSVLFARFHFKVIRKEKSVRKVLPVAFWGWAGDWDVVITFIGYNNVEQRNSG